MFLLALCLFGTALAAPAIPDAPTFPEETHMLMSPYIAYSAPLLPLRTLEMAIEPEPKEENFELPEPKEELVEPKEEFPKPEEPKDALPELPAAPELLKPEAPKPLVVKLEVPKPPGFISNWISSLPISLPNFSFPSFIGDWFRPTTNPTKVLLHPGYYPGYPVIIEAPKP